MRSYKPEAEQGLYRSKAQIGKESPKDQSRWILSLSQQVSFVYGFTARTILHSCHNQSQVAKKDYVGHKGIEKNSTDCLEYGGEKSERAKGMNDFQEEKGGGYVDGDAESYVEEVC